MYSRMYKTAYFILLLKCFGAYQPVFLLTPFDNTLLAQLAREEVYQKTKEIRKIALARAMASSVIETNEDVPAEKQNDRKVPEPLPLEEDTERPEDILKDWFTT